MTDKPNKPTRRTKKADPETTNVDPTVPETPAPASSVPESIVTPATAPEPIPFGEAPMTSLLTEDDLYLFNEGNHFQLYNKMGAHPVTIDGQEGTYFAVWAPNAEYIAVIGDWNNWDAGANPMRPRGSSGVWETFVPGVVERKSLQIPRRLALLTAIAKIRPTPSVPTTRSRPAPPRSSGTPPTNGTTVPGWPAAASTTELDKPMSIYEVHLGSWMRVPEDECPLDDLPRDGAAELAEHVKSCGFTHIELLPITEHPFYGVVGLPGHRLLCSDQWRFGTPHDFMYFVDYLPPGGHRHHSRLGTRRTSRPTASG
jgi:1,4-alpha-glucan branching enzyme